MKRSENGITPGSTTSGNDDDAATAAGLRALLVDGRLASAFQPIRRPQSGEVIAYEALCRPVGWPVERGVGPLFTVSARLGLEFELACETLRVAIGSARELIGANLLFVHALVPLLLDHSRGIDETLGVLGTAGVSPEAVVLQVRADAGVDVKRLQKAARSYARHRLRLAVVGVGAVEPIMPALAAIQPAFIKLAPRVAATATVVELVGELRASPSVGGAQIIAHGVESQAILDAVIVGGVDLAQGRWLGAPVRGPLNTVRRP